MAEVDQPPTKRAKVDDTVEEQQSAPSANAVSIVRLPGREVNAQRARLWQQLGSNALLFDVTLKASDRDVPCNRSVTPTGSLRFVCLHEASSCHPLHPSDPPPLCFPSRQPTAAVTAKTAATQYSACEYCLQSWQLSSKDDEQTATATSHRLHTPVHTFWPIMSCCSQTVPPSHMQTLLATSQCTQLRRSTSAYQTPAHIFMHACLNL